MHTFDCLVGRIYRGITDNSYINDYRHYYVVAGTHPIRLLTQFQTLLAAANECLMNLV